MVGMHYGMVSNHKKDELLLFVTTSNKKKTKFQTLTAEWWLPEGGLWIVD